MKKLPGYQKSKELILLFRQAGFSDTQISQKLLDIEKQFFTELVLELEKKMTEEEKTLFDSFLLTNPTLDKIRDFLKIDSQEISQKIDFYLQKMINRLTKEVNI